MIFKLKEKRMAISVNEKDYDTALERIYVRVDRGNSWEAVSLRELLEGDQEELKAWIRYYLASRVLGIEDGKDIKEEELVEIIRWMDLHDMAPVRLKEVPEKTGTGDSEKTQMEVEKRTHLGWTGDKDYGCFGKHQYICSSEKGVISLIKLKNYGRDGIDMWEIYCKEGTLFEGVERFESKEQAMKKIEDYLN